MIYPMPLPLPTWAFTFWFIIKGHLTTVPHDTLSQWDYGNARGSQIGEILDDSNLCNPSILGGNVHRSICVLIGLFGIETINEIIFELNAC